jgi:hypothetical protein
MLRRKKRKERKNITNANLDIETRQSYKQPISDRNNQELHEYGKLQRGDGRTEIRKIVEPNRL